MIGMGLGLISLITAAVVWSAFWKGWALWVAGKRREKIWFIVLFIVNTLGVLEIIYMLTRPKERKVSARRGRK